MQRVKYDSIRPTVRSGDVLAFEAKTFVGRLISAWTGSRYSHVGIAMWLAASGAEPRLFLLESRGRRGVTMRLLSGIGPCWYLPTNIQWTVDVNQFIWPRLGNANYDWNSIFRRLMFRAAKRDGAYYCSEFVGEVLVRGGFPVTEEAFRDPGAIVQGVLRYGPGQIFWLSIPKKSLDPEAVGLFHHMQPQATYHAEPMHRDAGY